MTAPRSLRSLPREEAEWRGSMPAGAGMDGTRRRRVLRRWGLQGWPGLGRPGAGPAAFT